VATDSLAAANDLQGGDQILAIDGTPVRSAQEVIAQVRRQPPQRPLRLTLQRQGQRLERVIRFARR
jgi:C-terminal processing protease CtpA/Prc